MTIQEALDETAISKGFEDWTDLYLKGFEGNIYIAIHQAMQLYADAFAEEKCKEQRLKCSFNATGVEVGKVLQTPLVTDKP